MCRPRNRPQGAAASAALRFPSQVPCSRVVRTCRMLLPMKSTCPRAVRRGCRAGACPATVEVRQPARQTAPASIRVASGGDLQAALDRAKAGDVIELAQRRHLHRQFRPAGQEPVTATRSSGPRDGRPARAPMAASIRHTAGSWPRFSLRTRRRRFAPPPAAITGGSCCSSSDRTARQPATSSCSATVRPRSPRRRGFRTISSSIAATSTAIRPAVRSAASP